VSDRERALMREHVGVTSRYEWMFWHAGWRREAWPV
jgi:thiaminase/transcriptional activator TenA